MGNIFNMKGRFLLEIGAERCPHWPKAWTPIPSYAAKGREPLSSLPAHPLAVVADGMYIRPILCL